MSTEMRWRRKSREDDLDREVQSHLGLEAEEQADAGLAPVEARHAAQRAFGNTTLAKEATREAWGWAGWERFRRDLRYSARTLRKTPGFTAAAVLSIALGIGANTAIFTLLNAVVFRPLPISKPQELVQLTYTFPKTSPNYVNGWFGYPQLERFRAQSKTLSGVFGGTRLGRLNVGFHGISELADGDAYTDNFFAVLGLAPQSGRFFSAGEDGPDASVAILSDRYWRTRFGADPTMVGGMITVNQVPFTVIGIAPRGFSGISVGSGPDVWIPLHAMDRLMPDRDRWSGAFRMWLLIAGRLRPEVSLAQAQAELNVIRHQSLAEELSTSELRGRESMQQFVQESRLILQPAGSGTSSGLRSQYALPLKLLLWVAGIVLLVACANVANLLLVRASNRRREIALKLALGAGRGRVMQQLLTESVLLAALGGALALAIAWWGSTALVRMISTGDLPVPLDVRPDWRVFGFTAALSLFTGVLFGMAPALRGTRVDPGPALKEGERHSGRSSRAMDRLLVVAQVALSVVLIAGAGLFVRSFQQLWNVNLGYDRENVLMVSVDAKLAGYGAERAGAVYRQILERLAVLPGVRFASVSIVRPVDDQFNLSDQIQAVDGNPLPERNAIDVVWNGVSPGYFSTIRTPILSGRDFDLRDDENAPEVAIINESLARRAFPGQDPTHHRLDDATIIGVVKDSNYQGARDHARPELYRPLFQHGRSQEFQWGFASFELRYGGGSNLLAQVRREVASVDRNLPVFRAKTLRAQVEQSLLRERLLATLSSFFGGLALLLACLGLYGLMAYAVARRTGEMGIRMALGARSDHLAWLVLRETLALTLAGIAVGVPLALWAARYAKSFLFGIAASDPVTIVAAIAALSGVAAVASYIPVRRSLRVDPMTALRCE
ncbi:MAG TPA: ABC transporter permease [Bryobacteraceae bacterium]|nr:ABC transporter permease [Bryobacteraceae bacterium]